jgi:tRNA G18 (ribose-2'-O)-methylase SpoU
LIEPIERAATRTAQQIDLALRQLRADEASRLSLLRNTDKALDLNSLSVHNTDKGSKGQTSSSGSTDAQPHNSSKPTHPLVLVLDNIRSAHNVGSMFRTAETARLHEVITCGITAHPPNPKLQKTALSAVEIVSSRHYEDVLQAIAILKQEGYHIVVMETTQNAQCYSEVSYPMKTAIVVGNEITGVDQRVIAQADRVVEIPMYGIKNSLNVASAAPVVVFEILRQWKRDKIISS